MKILLTLIITLNFLRGDILTDLEVDYSVAGNVEVREVSLLELQYVFTGLLASWSDGTKVTVVLVSLDNIEQQRRVKEILELSPSSFSEYINRSNNAKIVQPYEFLTTLANSIGSVGFISNTDVVLSTNMGLTILKIME